MFRILFNIAFLLIYFSYTRAAIDTVTVQNFSYSPSYLVVSVGDTVRFLWIDGNHPTASDNAAFGSFQMNSSSTIHDLVFTSAATYGYHCTFHGSPGSGMHGSIVVSAAQYIREIQNRLEKEFVIFPNPAKGWLIITAPDKEEYFLTIYNMLGKTVFQATLIDFLRMHTFWQKGLYLFEIKDRQDRQVFLFRLISGR